MSQEENQYGCQIMNTLHPAASHESLTFFLDYFHAYAQYIHAHVVII